MKLSPAFIQQMDELLGSECGSFLDSLDAKCRTSIRLHPVKQGHGLSLSDKVPWCNNAYYLDERPVFTLNPYFHAGHFYVQEASSMFIEYLLTKIDLPPNARILDLCSAPGGKASLVGSYLPEDCFIHCHETDASRAQILNQNIVRWGLPNYSVTQGSVRALLQTGLRYDLILLDAPCSGEGMFRKEKAAIQQWSDKKVTQCSNIQKQLIELAGELCKPNGYIFYSTCTYNIRENEFVVTPLVENGNFESIEITNDFPLHTRNEPVFTYRFLPHRTEGEGFTISILRKNNEDIQYKRKDKTEAKIRKMQMNANEWIQNKYTNTCYSIKHTLFQIPKFIENDVLALSSACNILHAGIPFGQLKGDSFYPNHGLSQSILLSEKKPVVSFNLNKSLDFLRCLPIDQTESIQDTWTTACYQTAKLGWIKKTPNGLKNYYPINLRIHSL